MKTIKVTEEKWFKNAPFSDVRMLGIKHLGIPADKFEGKQPEPFKRALVRQVFVKDHQYGEEFEVMEATNPFGKAKARPTTRSLELSGSYAFLKNGLRAPEGDIRREMMTLIGQHTEFSVLFSEADKVYGKTKYKSTGKLEFDFRELVLWALKRGWIERV